MHISDFNKFFSIARSGIPLATNDTVKELMSKYNISLDTFQRWRRNGKEHTFKNKYRYCKTCNAQFYAETSTQKTCNKPKCRREHIKIMAREHARKRDRKYTPSSYNVEIKRKMERRVSSKLAINSHKRYTEAEIKAISDYSKTAYQVGIEIGRSASSVELKRISMLKGKK